MADLDTFHNLTRVADAHPDIFPGSPGAVIGVFTKSLQARFSGDNAYELPYVWSADPVQKEDADNTEFAPRKLYIQSQYENEPLGRDRRPSLLVEKGETRYDKIAVGNRAEIDLPTMEEIFVTHASIPIGVLCTSDTRGESANLADVVAMFFLGSKDHLRIAFDLHDLTPPTVSLTTPEQATSDAPEAWVTTVSFVTTIKVVWRTRPILPVLREIRATMDFGTGHVHELAAIDLKRLLRRP